MNRAVQIGTDPAARGKILWGGARHRGVLVDVVTGSGHFTPVGVQGRWAGHLVNSTLDWAVHGTGVAVDVIYGVYTQWRMRALKGAAIH